MVAARRFRTRRKLLWVGFSEAELIDQLANTFPELEDNQWIKTQAGKTEFKVPALEPGSPQLAIHEARKVEPSFITTGYKEVT
jgi:hypothetical protein